MWNYTLDCLGQRFPRMEQLLHPPPLPLVRDGRLLQRNRQRELITGEELWIQVCQHSIAELAHMPAAYMLGDGQIRIIPCTTHGE